MQRGYFASAEKTAGSGKMNRLENGKTKEWALHHRMEVFGCPALLPTLQKMGLGKKGQVDYVRYF